MGIMNLIMFHLRVQIFIQTDAFFWFLFCVCNTVYFFIIIFFNCQNKLVLVWYILLGKVKQCPV